ncbi:GNAT family N-acetyltransferase [Lentzea nigeriaca]|uniref:GNAT family N-acetyltransferase n=1 Tax=Lentzea nigeriaca TaxID=1128665 RepID=UPI00195A7688|nr:GNAT family N-acetyltransferase [Lentzea nigeriaca]MBM7862712.1 GNAT superfamily N-acetyltransferase [Lentzea nigeriaca]
MAMQLRRMTAAGYRSAAEHREAESVRVLSRVMPEEVAWERDRSGASRFLPDGLDTAGHHLLTAEEESAEAVGTVRVGPDPGQASGSAWRYDINALPAHRRRGYGSAILAAVEALIAREGKTALGLNVVGDDAMRKRI